MKDGKRIIQNLAECSEIMQSGLFTKYDLKYIKKALSMLLDATEKTIEKNKEV